MQNNRITNRRKQWMILIAMSTMMIMINFDLSAINIALPSISSSLHLSLNNLSLVVSAYLVTWTIFLIPAGRLSDVIGTIKMFYIGAVIFALASGIAGSTHHFWLLIVCRVLQGLGAAIVFPVCTSISFMAFNKKERGTPVGFLMLVGGLSLAAGPVFGGAIIHYLGWRWIFYINIPIALFAILMASITIKIQKRVSNQFKFDYLGFIFLTLILISLVYALTSVQHDAWLTKNTFFALLILIVGIIGLIITEKHHSNPLLPIHLLQIKLFRSAIVCRLITNLAFLSILFSGPLYLQNILHYSANKAGLIFSSLTLMFAFFSYISGRLAKIFFARTLAIFGLILGIIGYISLSFLTINSHEIVIIFFLVIAGSSMGIVFVSFTTMAMREVTESDAAVANGLFFTFAVFGNMLGVTITTSIIIKRGMSVLYRILSKHKIVLTQQQIKHVQQLLATVKPENSMSSIAHYTATAFVSGFSMAMLFVAGLLGVSTLVTFMNRNSID